MTRKLKNHFGIDEELSQAINYVQNKVHGGVRAEN